jgi:hypothetical protein
VIPENGKEPPVEIAACRGPWISGKDQGLSCFCCHLWPADLSRLAVEGPLVAGNLSPLL